MRNTIDNFQPDNRVFAYILLSILSFIGVLQCLLMQQVAKIPMDIYGRAIPWLMLAAGFYFTYKVVKYRSEEKVD